MPKAIDILMQEHRLIEQVLGSLETCVVGIEQGLPAERTTIADYAAFFRGFADACHHGKEEDLLFARMIERGFPRETGPLAVMLHEHALGRARVRALREIGEAAGPCSPVEVELAVGNAAAGPVTRSCRPRSSSPPSRASTASPSGGSRPSSA